MDHKREPTEEPKGPWELWWERTHPREAEAERERRRRVELVLTRWQE